MENHKEKIVIFDNYAKEKGFKDWDQLTTAYSFDMAESDMNNVHNCLDSLMVHVYQATDLVQKEALQRASEVIKTVVPEDFTENLEYISSEIKAFKHSISSDKNYIK